MGSPPFQVLLLPALFPWLSPAGWEQVLEWGTTLVAAISVSVGAPHSHSPAAGAPRPVREMVEREGAGIHLLLLSLSLVPAPTPNQWGTPGEWGRMQVLKGGMHLLPPLSLPMHVFTTALSCDGQEQSWVFPCP